MSPSKHRPEEREACCCCAHQNEGIGAEVPAERNPHTLPMPVNINQKYRGNEPIIIEYGCAVCSAADVASYYAKREVTLEDLFRNGVYTDDDATRHWDLVPYAAFSFYTNQTQAEYYAKIKRNPCGDGCTGKRWCASQHLCGYSRAGPALS